MTQQQQQQQQQPSVILATASYDHTIRFWEAKSGRCYRTIQYPESQVNRLEITPDKRYLAAAGNPHIRLFDVNSNSPQPVMSYDSHTNNVMAVGFQCDGNWMYSGSEDGTVKIWDLRAPGCQREYESRAAVNTVVLHPNQTELISGDQNGNIRVWDLTANSCSCELVPEVDTAVRSLTVMWDGSLVVAANNRGTCYVWRLLQGTQTMTNFEPLHKLQAHDGYILKCLLSPEFCEPNRYLATASADNTVKIWNVSGFTLEKTLRGDINAGFGTVFSLWMVLISSQLLLMQRQDFGPCQLVKVLECIRGITKQPFAVLSMMELSLLLPDYGIQLSTSWGRKVASFISPILFSFGESTVAKESLAYTHPSRAWDLESRASRLNNAVKDDKTFFSYASDRGGSDINLDKVEQVGTLIYS
ncbi:unnamed protein product [Camellia sinensis]